MRIRDLPFREKPRERLIRYGVESLSDTELVALIIRTGNTSQSALDLAQSIISRIPLSSMHKSFNALRRFPGIGVAKSAAIVAAFELSSRISAAQTDQKVITKSDDVFAYLKNKLSYEQQEHFVGIYLTVRKSIIATKTLFIGTLDSIVVHPREILSYALECHADSFIIVHNHPSGDPNPSDEDITFTQHMIKASTLVQIPLIDHVIIGRNSHFSFVDNGLLKE